MAKLKSQTIASIGERGWLARVRRWFAEDNRALAIPIGDDAAAIDWPRESGKGKGAGQVIVSTDALIEGVHFRRDWTSMRDLGAKALAVNLSDLAAMGAAPVATFLALSVPPETAIRDLRDFFMGLRACGRRYGCPLAGGDMTRAPQWTIAVTVLGRPVVPGRLARRDTLQPGQNLYVTGTLGDSGAGLAALQAGIRTPVARALIRRHLRPTPRLAEAAVLVRVCPDLAMIDVSDGLYNDAGQLARASGVRVVIEALDLPGNPSLQKFAEATHADAFDWQLFGGEDYELLFATDEPESKLRAAWKRAGLRTPLSRIGEIDHGSGVALHLVDNDWLKVTDGTFRHF